MEATIKAETIYRWIDRRRTIVSTMYDENGFMRPALWARCEVCGKWHVIGVYFGEYYGDTIAGECGHWIIGGEYTTILTLEPRTVRQYTYNGAGSFICNDCIGEALESGDYVRCHDCGAVVADYDSHYIEREDFTVCDYCRDNYYNCTRCGDTVRYDDTTEVRYYGYVCNDCIDYFGYCSECGEYYTNDDMADNDTCVYCHDRRARDVIRSYHGSRAHGFEIFGRSLWLDGVELEVEAHGNTSCLEGARRCLEIMNTDGTRLQCEHDGSLENGFELVFSPHTREAWNESNYREVLAYLRGAGFTSHDNGRCGLHVHFDRRIWAGDEKPLANLVNAVCENYDSLYKIARRQSARWCRRNDIDDEGAPFKGDIMEKYYKCVDDDDRYTAVNLTNHNTVEIRLGRGTLSEKSFNAWLSVCWSFVTMSVVMPMGVADISLWLAMIDESAREYIESRGIYTARLY